MLTDTNHAQMKNDRLNKTTPMPKPQNTDTQPTLWHPCCLVTVDCGTVHNKIIGHREAW